MLLSLLSSRRCCFAVITLYVFGLVAATIANGARRHIRVSGRPKKGQASMLKVYLSGEIHSDWRDQITHAASNMEVAFSGR